MVVSQNRGPRYRPQKCDSPYYGYPKKVPLILGNPQMKVSVLKCNMEASQDEVLHPMCFPVTQRGREGHMSHSLNSLKGPGVI